MLDRSAFLDELGWLEVSGTDSDGEVAGCGLPNRFEVALRYLGTMPDQEMEREWRQDVAEESQFLNVVFGAGCGDSASTGLFSGRGAYLEVIESVSFVDE